MKFFNRQAIILVYVGSFEDVLSKYHIFQRGNLDTMVLRDLYCVNTHNDFDLTDLMELIYAVSSLLFGVGTAFCPYFSSFRQLRCNHL